MPAPRGASFLTVHSKPSRAMLGLTLAVVFSAVGCDEGARMSRTTRARVPSDSASTATEYPLPVLPRTWSAGSLVAPAKSGPTVLAEAAENVFLSGQRMAKAGQAVAARRDYDRAAGWIASSGYNTPSEPLLHELYGRIVAAREALELAGEPTGNGAEQAQAAELPPAAIDEMPDVANPVNAGEKKRAERDVASLKHDLPLTAADPVVSYLNFFETPRGRAIVARGLRRAGRYREMIARVLREEGVPQDLIYVAQAESAFEPLALSRARALGMWQFIAGSGTKYGLDHTWWVDERRDPEKSTRAAARYLRDLYGMFGDWYLALAAYNTGEGNVMKAVERTGYADFWELYRRNALLKQTRNYVPIILALAIIAKDPAKHGITFEEDDPLAYDVVKPGHQLDLRLAADAIDENVDLLKALNPELLKTVTPADPDFELRLPQGTAQQFHDEMSEVPPEKWTVWRLHNVERGDSLPALAHKFGVTVAAIAQANELDPSVPLEAGSKLVIPANHPAATGLGQLVRYRVRRGDTLARLARQFDVTPAEIEHWNNPQAAHLATGMTLKIYPGGQPRTAPSPSAQKTLKTKELKSSTAAAAAAAAQGESQTRGTITHAVKPGETLWSIAHAYQTTVEAIRAANPFLSGNALHAGDRLTILAPR
jgi:membrane-bound lytic murein transglycosylase D